MHGFDRNEAGKLFVGGLSWDTTKDSLLEYFSQYGEVIDCVVMKNPETGKSRGFGFVTYRDTSCVDTVLSVPAHIVDGRQVDPKACNPKGANRGGGGGGGGGGGHMGGGEQHRMNRGPRGGGGGGGPHGDKKIFLGGLPNGADEDAIRNFFGQYGKVLDVTVMYDAQKQRSRGFGFLTFESEDAVNQVCREHYINFNGKKVECKRATPRNQGNMGPGEEHHQQPPPQQIHVSHPGGMPPHMEMGVQPPPQGVMPGPEPQWTSPEAWNPQVHQGPPGQPMGVPPQFQQPGVQFQQGYQPEVQAAAPPGWPQQPPQPGGWPPGPPPQQPGVPPQSPQFTVSQTFASPQPAPGAPIYQYAASPPGQPPANGQQLQQVALAQPPPSSYGYTATSYATPAVAMPQQAGTLAGRPYQDFASPQQVQVATTVATMPGAVQPVSTVSYSYPSPYGAPLPAGAAPGVAANDPYAQAAALGHPQGAVAVSGVPQPTGQPAGIPGYGAPIAHATAGAGEPAAPKAVDYSSYYSAYGYAVETSPTAVSAAAYGAQPAQPPAPAPVPAQSPYGVQEVAQAVAYSSPAPGPSPTFQRQSSGQQYHPYARR